MNELRQINCRLNTVNTCRIYSTYINLKRAWPLSCILTRRYLHIWSLSLYNCQTFRVHISRMGQIRAISWPYKFVETLVKGRRKLSIFHVTSSQTPYLFFPRVYVFSSTLISSLTCLATSVNRKYVNQQSITCDLFGQHGRGGRHLWGTSKSPWIKLRGGAAKLDGINRYKRYLLL